MIDRRTYRFGAFELDVAERRLSGAGGIRVQLTARRFDTLVFMLERPNQLLSKRQLLDAVWRGAVVEENSLAQVVSWLRRTLDDAGKAPRYIETVPGVGYRFIAAAVDHAQSTRETPSIAVLPFDDLSGGGERYLAHGIAEDILNLLGQNAGLRVIGRASSFACAQSPAAPEAIGRLLGADYLLTGSVRRQGGRLRIGAQLLQAASGAQLWSERFERSAEDVFAIQDEIAAAAAAGVDVALRAQHGAQVTTSVEAHDRYLRARAAARRAGAAGMLRAVELYREALALDPDFVLAWLGLAEASRGVFAFAHAHAAEARRALDEAARRAVELAPSFWAAHLAEAWRLSLTRNWLGYGRALERAAELAPAAPPELSLARAAFSAQTGRMHTAIAEARRACRDDPLSLLPSNILQMCLHAAGRDAESEEEYQRSLDLPGVRDPAEHTALQRAWQSKDARLIEQRFARYLEHQSVPVPALHRVYAVRERKDEALQLLVAAAHDTATQAPVPQMIVAWWLAHYGDTDRALECAARAQLDFDGAFSNWLWFPVFAPVRRHPEFKELLRQLGLPELWRATGDWGEFVRPVGENDFECV